MAKRPKTAAPEDDFVSTDKRAFYQEIQADGGRLL
jgi:hypothetical protein